MQTNDSSRVAFWDNIKGVLIIFVVFAHFLWKWQTNSMINAVVDGIYMFHMPVFVFVSGYFGKSERAGSARRIILLAFLYFVFNTIAGMLFGFSSLLEPVYSYWYLLALIFWRLTAKYVVRFKYSLAILFAAALLAGFCSDIDNTMAISRIICFYPCYMCGYLFDNKISFKYKRAAGYGLIFLLLTGILLIQSFVDYSAGELMMWPYADSYGVIRRLVLFAVAGVAIFAFLFVVPDKHIMFITTFGKNSLWIFLLHRPVVLFLSDFFTGVDARIVIIVSLLLTFILCLLFGNDFVCKYLNRFSDAGIRIFTTEQKKLNVVNILSIILMCVFAVYILMNFSCAHS